MSYVNDTLYEAANEIFDTVVLKYDDDMDAYNNEPTYRLRNEAFTIIDGMIEDAITAMYDRANSERDDFLAMLHGESEDDE